MSAALQRHQQHCFASQQQSLLPQLWCPQPKAHAHSRKRPCSISVCCCPACCIILPCRKKPKADGGSDWDAVEATPAAVNRWDATPGAALGGATPAPNSWDATPGHAAAGGSRWDATPGAGVGTEATPARRNRWDETPAAVSWVAAAAAAANMGSSHAAARMPQLACHGTTASLRTYVTCPSSCAG